MGTLAHSFADNEARRRIVDEFVEIWDQLTLNQRPCRSTLWAHDANGIEHTRLPSAQTPLTIGRNIFAMSRRPRISPRSLSMPIRRKSPPAPSMSSAGCSTSRGRPPSAVSASCQPDYPQQADQMRQAHELRLAMLRARTPKSAPDGPRGGH
jgi:hypothetical protein